MFESFTFFERDEGYFTFYFYRRVPMFSFIFSVYGCQHWNGVCDAVANPRDDFITFCFLLSFLFTVLATASATCAATATANSFTFLSSVAFLYNPHRTIYEDHV